MTAIFDLLYQTESYILIDAAPAQLQTQSLFNRNAILAYVSSQDAGY
jgi:hypothetical protein